MKKLLDQNMEAAVILMSIGIFALIKLVMANKFAFLNLYFIPVLLAGYYLGRRPAILSSVLGVLLTIFFVVSWPAELLDGRSGSLSLGLDLLVWSSFLMLVAILVSTLNESRQQRVATATQELLKAYVQRSFEANDSHTKRVAELASAIARQLHLPSESIKQIEAAGLLHDLGENQLARDLTAFPASRETNKAYALITGAMPMAVAGREYRAEGAGQKQFTLGAKIVAIADLFDEISRKNEASGPNWESVEEIQRLGRFDANITVALRKAVAKQIPATV